MLRLRARVARKADKKCVVNLNPNCYISDGFGSGEHVGSLAEAEGFEPPKGRFLRQGTLYPILNRALSAAQPCLHG